jgi:hypothetical protein
MWISEETSAIPIATAHTTRHFLTPPTVNTDHRRPTVRLFVTPAPGAALRGWQSLLIAGAFIGS